MPRKGVEKVNTPEDALQRILERIVDRYSANLDREHAVVDVVELVEHQLAENNTLVQSYESKANLGQYGECAKKHYMYWTELWARTKEALETEDWDIVRWNVKTFAEDKMLAPASWSDVEFGQALIGLALSLPTKLE